MGVFVFACVFGLAMTGFYGMPRQVEGHGYARMAHVLLGSVFAVALAMWVMLTVQSHCFSGLAWPRSKSKNAPDYLTSPGAVQKLLFWVMLLSTVPLILSVTLNMFAWFDMDQQKGVVTVHVWNAVIVTSTAMSYGVLVLGKYLTRRKK